ncbi:MAG: CBS domain-containing protein [bacterium]|nr:CBS domain-containing protein [bacterium]
MSEKTRVNFHCHSDLSDGALPPEQMAALLARDGVRYASLVDHDTIAGLERFEDTLKRKGVGFIPGVEVTAGLGGREVHLLGYGFDTSYEPLRDLLDSIRRRRTIHIQSAIESLRGTLSGGGGDDAEEKEPGALVDCARVIKIIHEAGGHVFLAHPLSLVPDPLDLERFLVELKSLGLDGVEAYYAPYAGDVRAALADLARKHGLAVVAGTDFHRAEHPHADQPGMDVPTETWKQFRDLLRVQPEDSAVGSRKRSGDGVPMHRHWFRWRRYLLGVVVPVLLTIALFEFAIFDVFVPAFENALLTRKRDVNKDLTAVAVSILEEYDQEVQAGDMPLDDAQRLAIERLRYMRYGPEGKDYFWVTDMHPRMVLHPYRTELEGQDLTAYEDRQGKLLFLEFVKEVTDDGEGFVDYMWQWKDNPSRVAPKLSYVKLFEPWGWIVGTGIYVDDVEAEIHRISRHLINVSLAITGIVAILLFFIAQQGLTMERQRRRAEDALRDSHERYRTLVESAAEGTLMVLEGKCVFANRTLLNLLGYTEDELPLLDLFDLLPPGQLDSSPTLRYFTDLIEGKPCPQDHVGQLRQKSGATIDAAVTVGKTVLGGRSGFVITVRDASSERARMSVASQGAAPAPWLVQDLQASLMFLNEPIRPYLKEPPACPMDMSVREAARLMTRHDSSAALVMGPSGEAVGMVTDTDLRERVLAGTAELHRPVYEIMSSPLISVGDDALVYEAILRMQECDIEHLVVRDAEGTPTGLVRDSDLLQFHRYASAVVTREIERADSPEEIAEARARLPVIVTALLEAGTRPQSVMRFISAVHDAATTRLLRLALDRHGPPPVRFAFVCMGSQGRQEETLVTDQDNGIIYEDAEGEAAEAADAYFTALSKDVCSWLDKVGYDYCVGGVMAQNALWRGPLSKWRRQLGQWIAASEPTDLLKFDMVFDFRCVYGATDLVNALRGTVSDDVKRHSAFLLHFARNALRYKPPVGWFGQLGTWSDEEGARTVDLKEAMLPMVEFGRIYAVREGFAETNTLARLERMARLGLYSEQGHEETAVAYEYLMRIRLRHQAEALKAGLKPDNELEPKALTHIETETLREAFAQIATIQKHLSYDFLGVDEG